MQHERYGPLELDGDEASGALGGLCTASLLELGWQPPAIHLPVSGGSAAAVAPVLVTDLLGSGVTSDVYRITIDGRMAAAKVLRSRPGRTRDQLTNDCQRERDIYAELDKAGVSNVLQASLICRCSVGSERTSAEVGSGSSIRAASPPVEIDASDRPALLLTPVCGRLRGLDGLPTAPAITAAHLGQLVNAIEGMHRRGRVLHRDVRPENIGYGEEDGQLYLLDVGFAVSLGGAAVPWEGTLRYASPRVLGALAAASSAPPSFCATAADDLHSLVRCCYSLLHPHLTVELKAWSVHDASAIATFWQRRCSSGIWLQLTQLCDAQQFPLDAPTDVCARLPDALVYQTIRDQLALLL